MAFDPKSTIQYAPSLSSVSTGAAATSNGVAVAAKGWRWACLVADIGVNAATANDAVVKVQAATTSGGTYSDIAGATVTIAATADNVLRTIQVDLDKITGDFIRAVVVGGTGGAILAGAHFTLHGSKDTRTYVPTTPDAEV